MAIAQAVPTSNHVNAAMNYIIPNGEKPKVYIGPPEAGIPQRSNEFRLQSVNIEDARPIKNTFSLDKQGFEFHTQPTRVTDFYDDAEVTSVYYQEIETLLKHLIGATRVHIFDHTVRVEANDKREQQNVRAPVSVIHNDYTLRSGPQRIKDLLEPDEADHYLNNRFAEINIWRSIAAQPVATTPLAVADAQSIAMQDFIATDLVYNDRVGEIYQVSFNPKHRWYYFSKMNRDEILLLKCYDSATDGRARFTAHSAFQDPTARADAPLRESIEVRTLVSFAPE